ncbi:hypothetical protein MRS76_09610 [Rhizobiaceae bacterium n13]|uniref:Uncharacterized protein n=1 Tax=Ferirhizobium litorale TaxID=2927786 RepID=A0AAE3U2A5_9HYPH|nr:hypothetical protein [Fererhizobium litorale]MDI7862214.1 hypothetical protein [Fererhizobium litorale]MDI7922512.1 hypothetical protein [Fererhizobium litorale]
MSDCCSNPKVGPKPELKKVDSKDTLDLFNPEEVRLYGRPASSSQIYRGDHESTLKQIKDLISENKLIKHEVDPTDENAQEILNICTNIPVIAQANEFFSSFQQNVILAMIGGLDIYSIPVEVNQNGCGQPMESIGIIYGYSYEGHCYKLPKPQILCLPAKPQDIEGDKCGCDCGYSSSLGYAVWRLDKLSRVIAWDVRSDDIKTLILDANMPGNRSPLVYAQAQSLAPRRSHE